MMSKEFLERVLPEGLLVIAQFRGKGKGFRHFICENHEQASLQAQAIDRVGGECYFGLGVLREKKIYNEKREKWEVRVGENIRALKSLFIDIDVDAEHPSKYATREEAVLALRDFCKATHFPPPMIVSSGGGLHCYWPLTKEVDAAAWRPVAARFKAALLTYGLKADPTRTADASSVLRVVGTHNYKQEVPRPVVLIRDAGPYTPRAMRDAIEELVAQFGVVAPTNLASPPTALDLLPANTTRQFAPQDPPNFRQILMGCPQIQYLAKTGGEWEPTWYAGLQVVRHCENSLKAAKFISDKYVGFDEAEMNKKLNQLEDRNVGPATCQQFRTSNPRPCEGCAHWGKITSPIQLGRQVKEAPPPVIETVTEHGQIEVVTIPNPPWPYARRATGGIVVRQPDDEGIPVAPIIVHEYDMYPTRRLHSERHETESTIWRVKQPILGWCEVHVEQRALADPHALHGVLLSKGIYVPPQRVKLMVSFMVAYITELQKQVAVEQSFSRLGWRNDFKTFIMAEHAYHANGTTTMHQPSPEMKQEMPGLHCAGTLEGWKKTVQFYNNPGYDAHRFLFYTAFGAPLFHMTGYSGALLNATGKPGAGKSTTLMAINSVWGHPSNLMVNGTKSGTTPNALHTLLSIYNNLPFCLDEITRIDPKILGDFCLSVSQGQGKRRNNRSGQLIRAIETWSTTVVTTANTDVYLTLAGDRRDSAAESMRAFQIPIHLPGTHTKAEADKFSKQDLHSNYGHAAHVYAAFIAENYESIKQLVLQVTHIVDQQGEIAPAERFWSAIIASNIAGAITAKRLGLLDTFPIEQDCKWAVAQIKQIRTTMREHISSPKEILSEFLESKVSETIVVSQTQTAVQPRTDQPPRGALTIRYEKDTGLIFVMKSAFRQFCNETGAHFSDIQEALEQQKVLLHRNTQKVLGAGTDFGKGQVRCWMISVAELEK
jgi:hypothetical protein